MDLTIPHAARTPWSNKAPSHQLQGQLASSLLRANAKCERAQGFSDSMGRHLVWISFICLLSIFVFAAGTQASAPSISTLSPTSGAVGAAVTISGSGFGSSQGNSTVKFNGVTAATTSWKNTSIVLIQDLNNLYNPAPQVPLNIQIQLDNPGLSW